MPLPFDDDWPITAASLNSVRTLTNRRRREPEPPLSEEPTFFCQELQLDLPVSLKPTIDELREEISPSNKNQSRGHGTMSARVTGCSGPMCRKARRDYAKSSRRKSIIESGGTHRTNKRSERLIKTDEIIDKFKLYWEKEKK